MKLMLPSFILCPQDIVSVNDAAAPGPNSLGLFSVLLLLSNYLIALL